MRKILIALMLTAAVAVVPSSASAALITYSPTTPTTVGVGDLVAIDIIISGLGVAGPDTVSAFNLDVTESAAGVLGAPTGGTVLGAAPGLVLGGPLGFAFTGLTAAVASTNMNAISIEANFILDLIQPGSFTLGTVSWTALAEGTTLLGFNNLGFVSTLPIGPQGIPPVPVNFAGALTINVGQAAVPEPTTLLLLGTGLGVVAYRRRRADQ